MPSREEFWERNSKQVARDLITRTITKYLGLGNIEQLGVLTEVAAFDKAIRPKDDHLFSQKSGTVGVFGSRRGPIPTITAHAQGRTGLITLRALINGDAKIGPREIAEALELEPGEGYELGNNEYGFYLGQSGINLAREGLQILDEIPSGSPPNMVANYRLARK